GAKPAIMRNSVVLPQPDGPSSVKNSRSLFSSVMSATASTGPNERRTPSMAMVLTFAPLAGFLDQILDPLQRFRTRRGPRLLPVGEQLELGWRGHAAGQLGELEILASWAAEGGLDDHFAHVLAVDVVDERLGRLGIGTALDDGHALHLRNGAVRGVDGL